MRNTTDDPTWTSFIYHDHVSWFPGAAYPVEKLFRQHYAERYLASTSGTFRDIPNRATFFNDIATMRPEDWMPGTVDAIATGEPRRSPDRDQGRQLWSGTEHPARAIPGRRRSPDRCREVAHTQRRADGFRIPRASGCYCPGESNAELREGPHGGLGPLHGCRGRDPGRVIWHGERHRCGLLHAPPYERFSGSNRGTAAVRTWKGTLASLASYVRRPTGSRRASRSSS